MEKAAKSKSGFLSFIFLNQQPFSPGREKYKAGKGFSGPIISIIPAEARRKTRNGSFDGQQEPTSPKVSCIGQIKHKKKICKAKCANTAPPPAKVVKDDASHKKQGRQGGKKKQGSSAIGKLFKKGKKQRPRDDEGEEEEVKVEVIRAPGLGQMRKFSSGREAFRDFDYRAVDRGGAAAALNRARGYYSDDGDHSDDDDDDDDYEDDFQVPYSGPLVAFSAPLAVGGGAGGGRALEPRKEINIWKRRTMAPPRPLELISNRNKRL